MFYQTIHLLSLFSKILSSRQEASMLALCCATVVKSWSWDSSHLSQGPGSDWEHPTMPESHASIFPGAEVADNHWATTMVSWPSSPSWPTPRGGGLIVSCKKGLWVPSCEKELWSQARQLLSTMSVLWLEPCLFPRPSVLLTAKSSIQLLSLFLKKKTIKTFIILLSGLLLHHTISRTSIVNNSSKTNSWTFPTFSLLL